MSDSQRPRWQELMEGRGKHPPDSLSWLSLRALASSVNHVVALGAPELVDKIRAGWVSAGAAKGDRVIDRTSASAFLVVGDTGEQDASQYVVAPALAAEAGGKKPVDFMVICSDVIYPAGANKDYANGFYVPYQDFGQPVYALPGNHDWYDALGGFMWHFCKQELLPALDLRGVRERVAGRMWRSSPKADVERLGRLRDGGAPPIGGQPGPYFAIETAHVLLVCIDTGVEGTIDAEQGRWLEGISAAKKPKILLTGKPLVVNGKYEPCSITPPRDKGPGTSSGTVDAIVRNPAHRYIAAIGGDIHNYQCYKLELDDGRPFAYVVSGGGGAFMSATHPVPRREIKEDDELIGPQPTGDVDCYPQREVSLMFYASQLVPRLAELALWVAVAVIAIAAAGMAAIHAALPDDDLQIALAVAGAAAAGVTAVLWMTSRRTSYKDALGSLRDRNRRWISRLVAVLVGIAIGLAGWWLTGDEYPRILAVDGGLAAGGWMLALLLRVKNMWRLRLVQIGAYGLQLVVALGACYLVAPPAARPATWATILTAVMLASGLGTAAAWWLKKVKLQGLLCLLVACVGLAAWLIWTAFQGGDQARAIATVFAATSAFAFLLIGTDRLQRRSPTCYRAQVFVLLVVATAGIAVLDHRVGQAAVASLTILAVAVLGVAIAHLGFLHAFALLPHWRDRSGHLDATQAQAIVDWRAGGRKPDDRNVVRVGNLVYPGSRNPHGPLQQTISEIFDRDVPPFYKHFLRLESTAETVTITRIDVTGENAAPRRTVCLRLPLSPGTAE